MRLKPFPISARVDLINRIARNASQSNNFARLKESCAKQSLDFAGRFFTDLRSPVLRASWHIAGVMGRVFGSRQTFKIVGAVVGFNPVLVVNIPMPDRANKRLSDKAVYPSSFVLTAARKIDNQISDVWILLAGPFQMLFKHLARPGISYLAHVTNFVKAVIKFDRLPFHNVLIIAQKG
jgi:hypothetical protein